MPYVANANNSSYKTAPTRAYITTAAFNTAIFSYSTSLNGSTLAYEGTLTALTVGSNDGQIPTAANVANIVLKENGRKLFPGANPGVFAYMVGVYSELGFSGYIDPNNALFAIYNTDVPYFQERNRVNPTTNTSTDALVQGNPVYTAGSVTAGAQIRSTTVTEPTAISSNVTVAFDPSVGQVYKYSIGNATVTFTASAPAAGSIVYLLITGTNAAATINFGSGFEAQSNADIVIGSGKRTLAFFSDGTSLIQIATALTVVTCTT